MSYFNNYNKDEIVDIMKQIAEEELLTGKSTDQIVQEIMNVISYGMSTVVYILTQTKNKNN